MMEDTVTANMSEQVLDKLRMYRPESVHIFS